MGRIMDFDEDGNLISHVAKRCPGCENEFCDFFNPRWVQKRGIPSVHFDLTRNRRRLAILRGAKPFESPKEFLAFMQRARERHKQKA